MAAPVRTLRPSQLVGLAGGPVIHTTARPLPRSMAVPGGRVASLLAREAATTPQVAPRPITRPAPKPKSVFGQLGDIVRNLPLGLAHFVKDIGTDIFAPVRVGADVIGGHGLRSISEYMPAAAGLTRSFGHTGYRFTHPGEYLKAIREGRIVGELFEDIGNLAIIGGPAAKAIGAGGAVAGEAAGEVTARAATEGAVRELAEAGAREAVAPAAVQPAAYRGLAGVAARGGNLELAQGLQRVGNVVRDVTSLGERAANLPARPYQLAGRGLMRLGQAAGLEHPMAYLTRLGERVAPDLAFQATEKGGVLRSIKAVAHGASVRVIRQALRGASLGRKLGLSEAEARAVLTSIDLPNFGAGLHGLDADELGEFLDTAYAGVEESMRPTLSDVRMAIDYRHGKLAPEVMDRMNQVRDEVLAQVGQRTERAVARGLHPEQLDAVLRPTRISEFRAAAEAKRNRAQRVWERAENRALRSERLSSAADAMADLRIPPPTGDIPAHIAQRAGELADELQQATADYEQAHAAGATEQQIAELGLRIDQIVKEARQLRGAGWERTPGSRLTGEFDAEGNPLREPTEPPSPFERERIRQGELRARAANDRARANRVRRSVDRHNETIANAETELSRSFQDRLHEDVNEPTVNALHGAVARSHPGVDRVQMDIAKRHGFAKEWRQYLKEGAGDDPMGLSAAERSAQFQIELRDRGIVLDDLERRTLANAHGRDRLLGDMGAALEGEVDARRRLNSPYRVRDVIDQNSHLIPAETQAQIDRVMERYQARRANTMNQLYNDWTAAVPARFRTSAQAAQRQISALVEMAEKANKAHPGSGDVYLQLAEDTMSTLSEFVDAGFDPQHLIGGEPVTGGMGFGSDNRLTQPSLRSDYIRRSGLRPLTLDAYARLEAQQAGKWVEGRRNAAIEESFGQRIDELPELQQVLAQWAADHNGEVMPSDTLRGHVEQAGYAGLDPNTGLGPQSTVVPKQVYDNLNPESYNIPGLRALTRTNKAFKTWALPYSPKWQIGNLVGNILQAGFHAGVGPLELARRARQIAGAAGGWRELWRQEGLPDWAPEELANAGLSQEEFEIFRELGDEPAVTGKVGETVRAGAQRGYRINNFIDNVTRSSVLLSKLAEGETTDQALQTTLRSLGDYSRMSNFERQVVKQIFPFYPWLRHSIGATLRLPVQSPTRAAFLLHLADMYNDPNEQGSLQALMGGRIPIAGKLLNLGGISPFADISPLGFALDPMNIPQAMSPALKAASTIGLGFDPYQMRALSRPAGTARTDEFGRPAMTSPLQRLITDPRHGLGEIFWQLTQQGPSQIRSLRDLALGNEQRYSGTGYQIRNQLDPRKRSLATLARALNLPFLEQMPTGG
jgi:hypothetical protein